MRNRVWKSLVARGVPTAFVKEPIFAKASRVVRERQAAKATSKRSCPQHLSKRHKGPRLVRPANVMRKPGNYRSFMSLHNTGSGRKGFQKGVGHLYRESMAASDSHERVVKLSEAGQDVAGKGLPAFSSGPSRKQDAHLASAVDLLFGAGARTSGVADIMPAVGLESALERLHAAVREKVQAANASFALVAAVQKAKDDSDASVIRNFTGVPQTKHAADLISNACGILAVPISVGCLPVMAGYRCCFPADQLLSHALIGNPGLASSFIEEWHSRHKIYRHSETGKIPQMPEAAFANGLRCRTHPLLTYTHGIHMHDYMYGCCVTFYVRRGLHSSWGTVSQAFSQCHTIVPPHRTA
jgi:hypothetical protein